MSEERDSYESYQHNREMRAGFKMEWLLQIITIVFLAGGGFVTLDNVKALAEENKEDIAEDKKTVAAIEKKLVAIEVKQEDIKEDLEEQDKKLDKILEKLERIEQ